MPFKSKIQHRVITGQSREIISKLLNFMQQEASAQKFIIDLNKVIERVSAATGVSVSTIKRIKQEAKKVTSGVLESFSTPNKKRRHRQSRVKLDDFERCLLRRKIHDFHITEKQVPTVKKIYNKFCEETGYQGCASSLKKEIKKLGFHWRKTKSNRKILMEKPEIRHLRIEFLKKMKKYREERRPIVYMDETYIHSSHTNQKSWSDDSNAGLKKPVSKGTRLIIVNAGGEDGFVPNSYVRWKSHCSTGDYHNEMNYENYEKWVKYNLVPNLRPNSVVVIDNAPYHNKQIETCPTSTTRKDDMKKWLQNKNIPFDEKMLKPQLYSLIKMNKPRHKSYRIDQIFSNAGHSVVRLPPYHPDLNPIELVWADMKAYVAERNVHFTLTEVMKLTDDFFKQFSVEKWGSKCEKAKRFEIEFANNEPMVDIVVEELIINLGQHDSSSGSEQSSDEYLSNKSLSGIEELENTEPTSSNVN